MALSNTATPKYYGMFRDSVIRGETPVNETIPNVKAVNIVVIFKILIFLFIINPAF